MSFYSTTLHEGTHQQSCSLHTALKKAPFFFLKCFFHSYSSPTCIFIIAWSQISWCSSHTPYNTHSLVSDQLVF